MTVLDLEERVPQDHPLRSIKKNVDEVLRRMEATFEEAYSEGGRPSIPPEQLLKSRILMALFSVRSERMFCEQLNYNLLWLWFLDRKAEEGSFDHSIFSKNYERLLNEEVAGLFFEEVYELSREQDWASDEHFSADGTLIEAWASMKSFRPREDKDDDEDGSGDSNGWTSSNPEVDFRGQKRSNETHCSRTDPEAVLYRKGKGKESKLCFGAHATMENRNGLLAALDIHNPIAESEADVSLKQIDELHQRQQAWVQSMGGDKGYHTKAYVKGCRQRGIRPHVSQVKGRRTEGLDRRTTSRASYAVSQKIRKRIEEIFGWVKTVGGFRKTRYRGVERTQACASFVGAAYNLVRLAKLECPG